MEKSPLLALMRKYTTLTAPSENSGYLSGTCPFCDRGNRMVYSKSGDKFYCFMCGRGGQLMEFINWVGTKVTPEELEAIEALRRQDIADMEKEAEGID